MTNDVKMSMSTKKRVLGSTFYHPLTALEDDDGDGDEHDEQSGDTNDDDTGSITNGSITSSTSGFLLPLNKTAHKKTKTKILFGVSFQSVAVVTAALPLFGFLFCLVWSLLVQFSMTTATHCGVSNIFPSLSAATGSFYPQKYVWKLTISLHTVPRILVFVIYYYKHNSLLVLALNLMEVMSLLGLALFGSNENYPVHSKCFGTFLTTSIIYMFMVSYTDLFHFCPRTQPVKRMISWLILTLSLLAIFFFYRHNYYCEPYVYSLFALSEYIIVLGNIYFHFLAFYDLSSVSFAILTSDSRNQEKGPSIA